MPEKSDEERKQIIADMWAHLGRVMAEYPHLETIAREYTEIENIEALKKLKSDKQPAVFFGAHFGGWEINAPTVHAQLAMDIDITYRAPNNPWVDKMLDKMRSMKGEIPAHSKSREGGRDMMNAIKNGRSLGILIDQKYNQGLGVPFFGIEAMTNPFFVQLAQKYKVPLIPICGRRLDGCRFRLTIFDPVAVFDGQGNPRAVEDVIKDAHALLEEWIRQEPNQWLWLHRRWPDKRRNNE